jgi:beta-glucosidase
MNIEQMLKQMKLEDKVALGSGKDFWHTKEMSQYGISSIMMADGPHGLRKQPEEADMLGINNSIPATSFPTAALSSCSFDEDLFCVGDENYLR